MPRVVEPMFILRIKAYTPEDLIMYFTDVHSIPSTNSYREDFFYHFNILVLFLMEKNHQASKGERIIENLEVFKNYLLFSSLLLSLKNPGVHTTLETEMIKSNQLQNIREELQENVSLQLMHNINSSKRIRNLSTMLQKAATQLCRELYEKEPGNPILLSKLFLRKQTKP